MQEITDNTIRYRALWRFKYEKLYRLTNVKEDIFPVYYCKAISPDILIGQNATMTIAFYQDIKESIEVIRVRVNITE